MDHTARHTYTPTAIGAASCWPSTGGVRVEMVARQSVFGQRWQRQSFVCVESAYNQSGAIVYGTHGGGEGNRLVATSSRAAGQRGRHSGSLHTLLEYADGSAHAVRGHWLAGVQSGLVKALIGAGLHTWLLTEPNTCVEISIADAGGQADGSLLSGALFGTQSRWRGNCHRCRR